MGPSHPPFWSPGISSTTSPKGSAAALSAIWNSGETASLAPPPMKTAACMLATVAAAASKAGNSPPLPIDADAATPRERRRPTAARRTGRSRSPPAGR